MFDEMLASSANMRAITTKSMGVHIVGMFFFEASAEQVKELLMQSASMYFIVARPPTPATGVAMIPFLALASVSGGSTVLTKMSDEEWKQHIRRGY